MRLNTSRHFLLTFVTILIPKAAAFNVHPSTAGRRQQKFLLPNRILSAFRATEFDIGLENIPGEDWKRPGKVNQDAWFEDETDDFVIVGVLDGHGKLGHEVSSYYASTLPSEIKQRLESSNRIQAIQLEERLKDVSELPLESDLSSLSLALVDSFHAVHWNAMVDPDQKPGRSGATCITCLIDKKTKECHIACVGDSKAICIGSSGHHESSIQVVAERTTVTIPDERKRIESGEGSIRGNNVFYGPVGIAMTRALGDSVMLRAGVIPTPIVETFILQDCDTLVLATDGIWDVLQDQQVADTIYDINSAQDMAATLATIARKKWTGDLPIIDEVKADDITVLVLTCTSNQ